MPGDLLAILYDGISAVSVTASDDLLVRDTSRGLLLTPKPWSSADPNRVDVYPFGFRELIFSAPVLTAVRVRLDLELVNSSPETDGLVAVTRGPGQTHSCVAMVARSLELQTIVCGLRLPGLPRKTMNFAIRLLPLGKQSEIELRRVTLTRAGPDLPDADRCESDLSNSDLSNSDQPESDLLTVRQPTLANVPRIVAIVEDP